MMTSAYLLVMRTGLLWIGTVQYCTLDRTGQVHSLKYRWTGPFVWWPISTCNYTPHPFSSLPPQLRHPINQDLLTGTLSMKLLMTFHKRQQYCFITKLDCTNCSQHTQNNINNKAFLLGRPSINDKSTQYQLCPILQFNDSENECAFTSLNIKIEQKLIKVK